MPSQYNVHRPDDPRALNAPVVRLLMMGAGLRTDRELCAQIGINQSNFSRCMKRPEPGKRPQEPSFRTADALARRFPACPYWLIVVPADQVHDPAQYGMTWELVENGPDDPPGEGEGEGASAQLAAPVND